MKKSKSFTLIELLVVVIIIGILAAIAIPIYQDSVTREEMNVRAAELQNAFMEFRIARMKMSCLYSLPAEMVCKAEYNDSINLKYIFNLFCNDYVYAEVESVIKENKDLENLTWDEIGKITGNTGENGPKDGRGPIIAGEYAADGPADGSLSSISRTHNYKGEMCGMFVRYDGTVWTVYGSNNIINQWPW